MELQGKVYAILPQQEISEKMTKQELVIETDETYPQKIKVEFINDKIDLLKGLKQGTEVSVGINIRGNEYKGKYYNSIVGWKVSKGKQIADTDSDFDSDLEEVI